MLSHITPQHNRKPKLLLDKSGARVGKLTAVRMIERDPVYNRHVWEFCCDCGNTKEMSFHYAKIRKWTCCGCERGVGCTTK